MKRQAQQCVFAQLAAASELRGLGLWLAYQCAHIASEAASAASTATVKGTQMAQTAGASAAAVQAANAEAQTAGGAAGVVQAASASEAAAGAANPEATIASAQSAGQGTGAQVPGLTACVLPAAMSVAPQLARYSIQCTFIAAAWEVACVVALQQTKIAEACKEKASAAAALAIAARALSIAGVPADAHAVC